MPVELIEGGLNNGSNVVVTTLGTSGSQDGDIRLRTDIDKTSGGDARLSLNAAGDIRIDRGVDVRSRSGELTFELTAAEGRIRADGVGRMDTNGGRLLLTAKDGINFSSNWDMPDYLSVLLNNTDLGSSRRRVDVKFDNDKVKFDYSGNVADFYPGAITLLDTSSDGDVFIGFARTVDGRLYDRAVTGSSNRDWEVANFSSFGTIDFNALNGIPEVEGYPDAFFDFSDQPDAGFVPVLEISGRRDGTTDRYIVTAPGGQAILDRYLASVRPVTPVEAVVRQTEVPVGSVFLGPVQPTALERARLAALDEVFGFPNGNLNISDEISLDIIDAKRVLLEYDNNLTSIKDVSINANYAMLAWLAYDNAESAGASMPEGWRMVSDYQYENTLAGDMNAVLFKGPNKEYVLSFRGTDELADYISDNSTVLIPGAFSNQAIQAIKLAQELSSMFPNIKFVGHSLGGHLANVASRATGNDAVLFNSSPAALAEYLGTKVSGVKKGDLKIFRSENDPLSKLAIVRKEILVANIPKAENGHGIKSLALAMQEVQMLHQTINSIAD